MTTNEVQQILVRLAGLEATITGKFEQLAKDNEDGVDIHKDHETRIRALERVRWTLTGAALLVGGGLGAIAQHLAK